MGGGSMLSIEGVGFYDHSKEMNKVNVCGFECIIDSVSFNGISCFTPKLILKE